MARWPWRPRPPGTIWPGAGRLRVRVFAHHPHWPRLSLPPSLTVDRRLMSARDQARHDRLMESVPGVTAVPPATGGTGGPGRRAGIFRSGGGFSVRLPGAPQVTVSTVIGLDRRPAPSRFEV